MRAQRTIVPRNGRTTEPHLRLQKSAELATQRGCLPSPALEARVHGLNVGEEILTDTDDLSLPEQQRRDR